MNTVESTRGNDTLAAAAAYGSAGHYDPDDVLPPASPILQPKTLHLSISPRTPPPKVTEVQPSRADGVLLQLMCNRSNSDIVAAANTYAFSGSEDEDDESSPEPEDPISTDPGPATEAASSQEKQPQQKQQQTGGSEPLSARDQLPRQTGEEQQPSKLQQQKEEAGDDQWARELLQLPSRLPHETLVHRQQQPTAASPEFDILYSATAASATSTTALDALTLPPPGQVQPPPLAQPHSHRALPAIQLFRRPSGSHSSQSIPPLPRSAGPDRMSLDVSAPPVQHHHQSPSPSPSPSPSHHGTSDSGRDGTSSVFTSMAQAAMAALAATETDQPKREPTSPGSHDLMSLDPRLDRRQRQLPPIEEMTHGENASQTAGPNSLKLKSMALGALSLDEDRKCLGPGRSSAGPTRSSLASIIHEHPDSSVETESRSTMTPFSEPTQTMDTPVSMAIVRDVSNLSASSTPVATPSGSSRDERLAVGIAAAATSLASPSSSIQSPNDYTSTYSSRAGSSTASPHLQQQSQGQAFSPRSRSSSQVDPHYQTRPSVGSSTTLPPPLPPIQQYGSPPVRARSDSVSGPQTVLPPFHQIASIGSLPEPALDPRRSVASASASSSFSHPSPGTHSGPGSLSRPRLPSLSHHSSPPPISPDEMYRLNELASPASASSLSAGPSSFYFSPISAGGSSISSVSTGAYSFGDRRPTEYSVSSTTSTASSGAGMVNVPQLPVPQPMGASGRGSLAPTGGSSVRSASIASSVASRGSISTGIALSPVGAPGSTSNSRLPSISSSSTHVPADHQTAPIYEGLTLIAPHGTGPGSVAAAGAGAPPGAVFVCKVPGCTAQPFQTQYLLNSHANVHSSVRPHYCPVAGCPRSETGKGFKRKNEMIRHGLVHASPGYVCPFCPEREHRYPRPDNLQRHVKAHHKDKSKDDPELRDVLSQRPDGPSRGRRRRLV